ncbi:acetyl-CoA decarbonylase/synthase complex subunit beta [Chloroflexota bacterium]
MAIPEEEAVIKLPPARVFQLPTELDHIWDGLDDIGLGLRWLSEVKKADVQIELGGPKQNYEMASVFYIEEDPEKVKDGEVKLIGPDVPEVEPGTSLPGMFTIRIYGQTLTPEHQGYVSRQIGQALQGLEGFMLFGTPEGLWIRISRDVADRLTFAKISQFCYATAKTLVPSVDAVAFFWAIGSPEVGGRELIDPLHQWAVEKIKIITAKQLYDDEDVDTFYGCTICKSLAPNHACVLTPSSLPYCGIIGYDSAKVTCEMDPEGYVFSIPKGECLDEILGHYSGVDEAIWERCNHLVHCVNIYSSIRYPTTNCGCFEAASFYIPEVDGIGLAMRRYTGMTPLGIKFSTLAGQISGGAQNHGFKGLSIAGMSSENFLKGDGGWNRIVWMPTVLKEEVAEAIPEEVYDRIVTEEETLDPSELKKLLVEKGHPIVEMFWKDGVPQSLDLPLPGEDWPDW